MLFDDVIYEKNVIDHQICDDLVDWFEKNEDLQHQAMLKNTNTDQNEVDDSQLVATRAWGDQYVRDTIIKCIDRAFLDYRGTIGWPWQYNLESKDFSVRKYPKGKGFFNDHIDTATELTYDRLLAFILYLNTVDDGGETEFFYTGRKIKPVKGKILLFPCNYLFAHRGHVPMSNDKYIATSFIYRC